METIQTDINDINYQEGLNHNKEILDSLESKVNLVHTFAHKYNIVLEDKIIGFVDLPLDLDGDSVSIGDIEINQKYRGTGLGVEAYKAIIMFSDKPIETFLASDEANHVRDSLVRKGLAIKKEGGGLGFVDYGLWFYVWFVLVGLVILVVVVGEGGCCCSC